MISSLSVVKAIIFGYCMTGNMVLQEITSANKDVPVEVAVKVQEKIDKYADAVRILIDEECGEGFFDEIISGRLNLAEFLACDDLERFIARSTFKKIEK